MSKTPFLKVFFISILFGILVFGFLFLTNFVSKLYGPKYGTVIYFTIPFVVAIVLTWYTNHGLERTITKQLHFIKCKENNETFFKDNNGIIIAYSSYYGRGIRIIPISTIARNYRTYQIIVPKKVKNKSSIVISDQYYTSNLPKVGATKHFYIFSDEKLNLSEKFKSKLDQFQEKFKILQTYQINHPVFTLSESNFSFHRLNADDDAEKIQNIINEMQSILSILSKEEFLS